MLVWIFNNVDDDDITARMEGEDRVINELKKLDDNYYLANDIILNTVDGNIDHIIFGSNMIGVIETKNYSGSLTCEGDQWYRTYPNGGRILIDSPSIQVKKNAIQLRNYLESKGAPNRWVDPIVVFSEPNVQL